MKSSHQHNAVNSHLNARHFNGPIEDRLAIRELLDSYSDAVIRRDQILWSSCWAMNASWHLGSQIIVGRDAILSHWIDMKANSRGIKGSYTRAFFNFPGAVNIDGDKAQGWSYTNELLVDDENMTYHLNGMYSDLYVRENGQWVFEERVFAKLHIDHPY
ncbi:nuclear transport factor 2 family protein [Sphingorhabdus sp.]|jgi:hypothetical protein|uniref:nuclear transport factor 2 family protein n=1 Tax=Sphingorhabdus sp. TaxID=1902408 RepID=UPI0037C9857F